VPDARDCDTIAEKLRERISRRRQLGYAIIPVSVLDLECLIVAATHACAQAREATVNLRSRARIDGKVEPSDPCAYILIQQD
jgi:hypothetical protein